MFLAQSITCNALFVWKKQTIKLYIYTVSSWFTDVKIKYCDIEIVFTWSKKIL